MAVRRAGGKVRVNIGAGSLFSEIVQVREWRLRAIVGAESEEAQISRVCAWIGIKIRAS
jgi:hypothetical protein